MEQTSKGMSDNADEFDKIISNYKEKREAESSGGLFGFFSKNKTR
jgi:hypothetical protein